MIKYETLPQKVRIPYKEVSDHIKDIIEKQSGRKVIYASPIITYQNDNAVFEGYEVSIEGKV